MEISESKDKSLAVVCWSQKMQRCLSNHGTKRSGQCKLHSCGKSHLLYVSKRYATGRLSPATGDTLSSCSFLPREPIYDETGGDIDPPPFTPLTTNRLAPTMARPTASELERMLGSGQKGTIVIWATESRQEVMHALTLLSPTLTWQELPLLSKLGIHKAQFAKPDSKVKGHHLVPDIVDTRNFTLENFTTDYDPASPTFGIPGHTARGQIVLRRNIQKPAITMTKNIIESVELFLRIV